MSMNLHAIAGPIVGIVSGTTIGEHWMSTGNTTAADGSRAPTFATRTDVEMQVQALTGPELALIESLNIQGVKRAVHMMGDVRGVDRKSNEGGDILKFNGDYWLVAAVLETWDASGWCRVAVVKQVKAPDA